VPAYVERPKYNYSLMLKNPSVYRKMVNTVKVKGVESKTWKSGNGYERNRGDYVGYIYRFVGEAIRNNVDHIDLVNSTHRHIQYLNHDSKDYASRARLMIEKIEHEQKYRPWGMLDLICTRKELANYAHTHYAFGKHKDFLVFSLLNILQRHLPINRSGYYEIFKPNALYHSANIQSKTAHRSFNRLSQAGLIDISQLKKTNTLVFRVLDKPVVRKKDIKRVEGLLSTFNIISLFTHTAVQEDWVSKHTINRNITPGYYPSAENPLVELKGESVKFTFGLTTLEEVLYAVFGYYLKSSVSGLQKTSPMKRIDTIASDNYAEMFDTFKYPVSALNHKYISVLAEFRTLATKAVDLGIPFNRTSANIIENLLPGEIERQVKLFNNEVDFSIKQKMQKEIEKLSRLQQEAAKYAYITDNNRIKSTWNIRGTITNRTQTTKPNIQGMSKELRYLLKDDLYYSLAFDISGFEIYIALLEAGEKFDSTVDLFRDISTVTGIQKSIVKSIIHPKTKGAGIESIYKDLTKADVLVNGTAITEQQINDVVDAFYKKYPLIKIRYDSIFVSCIKTGLAGIVPYYDLNVISLIDENASTAGVAHVDQTIGSSIVKTWAVNYTKTTLGKEFPIILDWHDNLTLQIPRDTPRGQIADIETTLSTCLDQATSLFNYPTPPLLKVDDLTGLHTGRPSYSSMNDLVATLSTP
jgi:hypothetical protein